MTARDSAVTLVATSAAATIDDAARYIAGHLASHRLLETTDPHGWDLARQLGVLADTLDPHLATSVWVEATLPRAHPCSSPNTAVNLFPDGGDAHQP